MATSSTPTTSQSAFTAPVVKAINHLLAQEAWARDALELHAGKEALIDAGSVALRMRVTRDGMVEASRSEDAASVTIRVKLSDLPLIAVNRERAFSYVKIEGDAEFANTISQLSKGLRWEAEHDLERMMGPIAASRLAEGARSAFGAARTTQRKVSENLAEYFVEENPLLVRKLEVEEFADDVTRLRDDVERSAKRVARLEQLLAQRAAKTDNPTGDAGKSPTEN
ncbi:ubiquinone biosynthesis accessory factor UbiJ [Massilia cavernae]|uniref:Ubiquinone biosynthesis accessory factor UbiJ n=1 Tax=Massilia cavernae TaxID=2320864 RepID=A0A418X7V6_9BURK|nr:SCP2 sterol-binding domain-containing protein [Massilia cavernae]RJG08547.1 sterol-binding protein [Massilia cavernae]